MRVWPILVLFGMLPASACKDSSGPDGPTITFNTDPVTCADQVDFEITIDGQNQGSFHFAPGSEWTFSVEPGVHSIKAVGITPESGFTVVERDVVVAESENFVVPLSCNP